MLCPWAQALAPILPIALKKEKNKMNGTLTVKCSGQSGLNSLLTPWGKCQACSPTGPRQVCQEGSAVSWWSALRTGSGSRPQSGHEHSAHPPGAHPACLLEFNPLRSLCIFNKFPHQSHAHPCSKQGDPLTLSNEHAERRLPGGSDAPVEPWSISKMVSSTQREPGKRSPRWRETCRRPCQNQGGICLVVAFLHSVKAGGHERIRGLGERPGCKGREGLHCHAQAFLPYPKTTCGSDVPV